MVTKLMKLINKAGYHLQQIEQAQHHGLKEVEYYNKRLYDREIAKIRVIRELLG